MKQLNQKKDDTSRGKRIWAILFMLGLIIVLVLIGIRLFAGSSGKIKIGESPGNFALKTFSGQEIRTEDLNNKVILLNFWASWCVPCDEEARLLEQAWQKINRDYPRDVIFIGVAYMDTDPASREFLSEYGITYPNAPDLRSEISTLFQVKGVPETFILDRDGKLQYVKFGQFLSTEEILTAVETVIGNQEDN